MIGKDAFEDGGLVELMNTNFLEISLVNCVLHEHTTCNMSDLRREKVPCEEYPIGGE